MAAAVGLWLDVLPLASLALAGLVFLGRRETIAPPVDAIVYLGLAGRAEPVWVAALIAASWIAGTRDVRNTLILLLASAAAIIVPVDWTVLTALLALIAVVRAALAIRRSPGPAHDHHRS